jgi:hypothetical protein
MFSEFLCCVGGLVSLEFMAVFKVVNLWIGPGFIFESVVNFQFFSRYVPVTTLD